ncbi:MAG: alanine--tRNA ligase [Alphaproteobacteria bacterium]|nr:alanine--tRNA ligase [Alphaproteobacteria bacterium]
MAIKQDLTPDELRQSFLDFMEAKGAAIVPSSSLLPENDPTTLFTGSGMQPMIPYLLGEKHPSGTEIANVQRCLRTVDIDGIGDISHLTFFEMIGRWEFGGDPQSYKKDQIERIWTWQVETLGLDPRRLYVTVFIGNESIGVERDNESIAIWTALFQSVGIDPVVEEEPLTYGLSRGGRIFLYGAEENWWSRAGVPEQMPVGEPGGPDSEMFYDFRTNDDDHDHPASDSHRFLEIGNNVFMGFKRQEDGFAPLTRPNIDYGGGLERVATALNNNPDIYETAFFQRTKAALETLGSRSYAQAPKSYRIILDHTRAATFLIGDGADPSNTDAGYITRRLIRRAIREGKKLGIDNPFLTEIAAIFIDQSQFYRQVSGAKDRILNVLLQEEQKFQKTLHQGEMEIKKHLERHARITGKDAFYFYETYGFPLELTKELLSETGQNVVDVALYEEAAAQHAEASRTAAAGKFKGGLADNSDKTKALHTTAHIMLAGLRKILGEHVHQKGSNITAERIRFDFSHPAKMEAAEKQAVEDYVNQTLSSGAHVEIEEMPKQAAYESGVEGSFWEKYPDQVKVYTIKDAAGNIWSRELCGGPHVDEMPDISQYGIFKIEKEESSSAGVRRIKAVLK